MGKVEERKGRRKEQILVTAQRLLATNGFHETGIADIATELGMGHGTFYRYFKNKQHIAEQVLERCLDRFVSIAMHEAPTTGDTLDEYRAQVERLLLGGLSLAESDPDLIRVLFEQSYAIDREFLSRMREVFVVYTRGFLQNGANKHFLRAGLDIEFTAQMLVALVFDGTRQALGADHETRLRWKDAGMALMFHGIAARHE